MPKPPDIDVIDTARIWFEDDRLACRMLHREDGPAIEDADGSKGWYLQDVWMDGKRLY